MTTKSHALGKLRCSGRWSSRNDRIIVNIFEGSDGRFLLELDLPDAVVAQSGAIDRLETVSGSDRTLQMAQDGDLGARLIGRLVQPAALPG